MPSVRRNVCARRDASLVRQFPWQHVLHAIRMPTRERQAARSVCPRHVASTGKQAGNGDIFVDVLPVEALARRRVVRLRCRKLYGDLVTGVWNNMRVRRAVSEFRP